MSRLTSTPLDRMSEEQKSLIERIGRTEAMQKNGQMGGPHDVWILNPELARRAMGLGDMYRFRSSMDRRYVELTILVTGAFWQAQYEWYAHEPMAREAGVPEPVIKAIKEGREPDFDDDADRAAWKLATEMLNTGRVRDESFADAVKHFGEQGVAELANLIGYYTMVSMTLNTFDVPLPEGAEYPWPK
ncbi:MAG: carboxymuconolactone decarboxylase family protein [Pseudomonadales bacterium]|nr:carboxymuconolactone decarboxylase family protein [Pseudomonadales bacterium]